MPMMPPLAFCKDLLLIRKGEGGKARSVASRRLSSSPTPLFAKDMHPSTMNSDLGDYPELGLPLTLGAHIVLPEKLLCDDTLPSCDPLLRELRRADRREPVLRALPH